MEPPTKDERAMLDTDVEALLPSASSDVSADEASSSSPNHDLDHGDVHDRFTLAELSAAEFAIRKEDMRQKYEAMYQARERQLTEEAAAAQKQRDEEYRALVGEGIAATRAKLTAELEALKAEHARHFEEHKAAVVRAAEEKRAAFERDEAQATEQFKQTIKQLEDEHRSKMEAIATEATANSNSRRADLKQFKQEQADRLKNVQASCWKKLERRRRVFDGQVARANAAQKERLAALKTRHDTKQRNFQRAYDEFWEDLNRKLAAHSFAIAHQIADVQAHRT